MSASPPAPEAAGRSLVSVGIGLLLTALHLAVMVVTCGAYVSGPTILVEAAKFLVLVIGGPGMIGLLVLFYLSIAALLALPPVGIVLANLRWPVCKLASAAIAPICMVLLAGQWALVRQVNPALPDRPPDERPCVRFTGDLSANQRACHVSGDGLESPDCPDGMWCNLVQPTQDGRCEIHCSYSCECPHGMECRYGEWCEE